MRLLNGSTAQEGRVDYCHNGTWSTVCDDGWDRVDASIVCQQLGYSSAGRFGHFYMRIGVHAYMYV